MRNRRHPFPGGHEHGGHEHGERGRSEFGPWAREFGEFAFGPGGRGRRGHGPGGRRGPGPRRGRRGDVRAAILALLAEQPRHGYEIIREIGERSGGLWKPSPGSIYPTLQMLADEGLVVSHDENGKKLFELTGEGSAAAEQQTGPPPWEHFADDVDPAEADLRKSAGTLAAAVVQVMRAGSPGQQARAVDVLNEARRSLYSILGEAEDEPGEAAE
ncbi:PadR family transcriptional regulator [Amycolatopsis jiangsuensis]|uniref:DNA-binding PadR family transcriptional regulator n=1 Tax=Amycolatopsis jiangsuensis TaxID=1181879 RepID=A0A840IVV9_9PSEU|nr:PadR family transcriptional regulator [Amycolatopsis jiangsuensis]MBB4685278.1 DNA-binding PadR family transcriptional regulator [Amycolatopsis jiangsuensis]